MQCAVILRGWNLTFYEECNGAVLARGPVEVNAEVEHGVYLCFCLSLQRVERVLRGMRKKTIFIMFSGKLVIRLT